MEPVKTPKAQSGKTVIGLIFVIFGAILLLRQFDLDIPRWLTSWPMVLIVIGLYLGYKQDFRNPGPMIMIVIGLLFLSSKIFYFNIGALIWPAILVGLGIYLISGKELRRKKRHSNDPSAWDARQPEADPLANADAEPLSGSSTSAENAGATEEDVLDTVAVFGGVKKNIFSRSFKGGEVVCIFGGSELNLLHADIQGKVYLEVVQIFGGTKILIPADWTVYSEMAAVFGGVEDKRPMPSGPADLSKILVIKGTSIFGGIDIKSF